MSELEFAQLKGQFNLFHAHYCSYTFIDWLREEDEYKRLVSQ